MNVYSTQITVKALDSDEANKKLKAAAAILSSPYLNADDLEKLAKLAHDKLKVTKAKAFI